MLLWHGENECPLLLTSIRYPWVPKAPGLRGRLRDPSEAPTLGHLSRQLTCLSPTPTSLPVLPLPALIPRLRLLLLIALLLLLRLLLFLRLLLLLLYVRIIMRQLVLPPGVRDHRVPMSPHAGKVRPAPRPVDVSVKWQTEQSSDRRTQAPRWILRQLATDSPMKLCNFTRRRTCRCWYTTIHWT